MFYVIKRIHLFYGAAVLCCMAAICLFCYQQRTKAVETVEQGDFIRWMDFNVTQEALHDTMQYDVNSHGTNAACDWISLLAYLAAKNGNDFSHYKKADLTALTERLQAGENMDTITQDMKYFSYYHETFSAVLSEYIGNYARQIPNPADEDEPLWEETYGLRVFSPIAAGFGFEHYDDFAKARTYGYKRRHTGHDLFGSIGTPVIAVESGVVESAGWNQYGGWRIGIRSFDKKRYYYYAHLRKDAPYSSLIKEGAVVTAGDVIGYLGMTGYSTKENVNNINVPHLHFGIQIIFDESQKDGNGEIWIDGYQLVKFLQKNRSEVIKEEKEYRRKYQIYNLP